MCILCWAGPRTHSFPMTGTSSPSTHSCLLILTSSGSYNVSFPTYLGASYDASVTNLTYSIPAPSSYHKSTDSLELVLSFLSPITPTSTLRQAIPASYLTVHVKGSFDLGVYIDVNGQWVSGNRGNKVVWDLHQSKLGDSEKGLKTWKVKRETEQLLTEYSDQAEWGTLHFTAPSVSFASTVNMQKLNTIRTCSTNQELLHNCDSDFQGQVPSRMQWMMITAALWMKNPFLRLPNPLD